MAPSLFKPTALPLEFNEYTEDGDQYHEVPWEKRKQKSRLPRLFELPAELRNTIYEYALTEREDIKIHEANNPPEWINTCRQMMRETLKMYYDLNTFFAYVDRLDARKLVRWFTHVETSFHDPMYTASVSRSCNWENLIAWCKDVWSGLIPGLSFPISGGDSAETCTVVVAAHNIAYDYSDETWEHCLRALENLREVIKVYEPGWSSG